MINITKLCVAIAAVGFITSIANAQSSMGSKLDHESNAFFSVVSIPKLQKDVRPDSNSTENQTNATGTADATAANAATSSDSVEN